MSMSPGANRLLIAALCANLVACGSAQPLAYSGIESSSLMAPNKQDDSARVPYRYSTPTDWRTYSKVMIDPVTIYRGHDQQFGNMSEEDKAELARYMLSEFTNKLGSHFARVSAPAPNTLRVKLTLTGAATNTPVLSFLSHLDLAGNLYNGVQAARGREGMMSGSVTYVVELYDAQTNRLLSASVIKQYPGAMNIASSFGSLAAAKTGIDKGAEALVETLQ